MFGIICAWRSKCIMVSNYLKYDLNTISMTQYDISSGVVGRERMGTAFPQDKF